MSYLLDANVFIQAKNLHYGLDFCPAFWDWIIEQNNRGRVFSIDKVADEIEAGKDELTTWMHNGPRGLFRTTDSQVATQFAQVSQWVTNQNYDPAAINTFMQVADYYLIAHALATTFSVVTHEIPSNSIRRIKIPNVCIGLNIRFMTPFEMLRREKARFILGGIT